ncbi:sulfatase-like hydrolase/transferase [Photobacterium damselae subsp. piscicida]|nr:sulfatase-like hydrolase/transferase [Photobacterium damselae subsp. piscicida]
MGSLPHNRYKNALFYIDGLIAKVLKHIDLQNTIIVITSDHGQEFNDNKQNYWGHSATTVMYKSMCHCMFTYLSIMVKLLTTELITMT